MISLRVRSVRNKLILIVLMTNVCSLLVAGGALLYYDLRDYQAIQVDELRTEAEILAEASIAALDFNDAQLARDSLALLEADPRVRSAALYLPDGQLFARYGRNPSDEQTIPAVPSIDGLSIEPNRILLSRRVQAGDRIVGTLYIDAHFGLRERMLGYLQTLAMAMIASVLAGTAVSVRLRQWVTLPIKRVTETAKEVMERRDFTLRAKKISDDEIGYMVDAFNSMLAEIAARTEAIQASKESIELEVKERRAIQASLERSELRNRSLVTALSSLIWTADSAGGFNEPQPAWSRYTGQDNATARGLGWRSAFLQEDQASLDRVWSVAIHGQQAFELEARLWHQDSRRHRWVVLRAVPLKVVGATATEWIGAIQDVDDRRSAESEVRKLNSELEQRVAERTTELEIANQALQSRTRDAESANRSKAEFLANMSHEIRTPMNAVLGLAYLLERQPLEDEVLGLVRKIRLAGRSLQSIINDILDFSKIEAGRLEIEHAPFELHSVLDSLASIMAANAGGKDIELAISPPPDRLGRLIGDPLRLEQVLINLTGNAIKFTESGVVAVTVKQVSENDQIVQLLFSVRDTGIGIPEDKLPLIFSAFAQADSSTTRRFGGTGLGLAICRHLITQMGGEIGVNSEPGRGSEFWFCLPFERIDATTLVPEGLNDLDILVADDSEAARQSLLLTAQSMGWRATAVDSGEAALDQVIRRREREQRFDVIVLDWRMPEMDGLSAARHIRNEIEDTKAPIVIMATAYARDELAAAGADQWVDAVLSKPVTSSGLFNAVAQAKRRRERGRTAAAPAAPTRQRIEGIRVLVVDDSDINREVASRILRADGAQVRTAENGQQALEWLLQHSDSVDIVLMDVQMPVLDGYEATRSLRRLPGLAKLPVVALTAGAFKTQIEAAREAGMNEFVAKPFDVDALMRIIQRLTRDAPAKTEGDARAAAQASASDTGTDTDTDTDALALADANAEVGTGSAAAKVIDWNRALASWCDRPVLLQYLHRFVDEYEDVVELTEQHLAGGDRSACLALLHKLKGGAGSLALSQVFLAAQDFEQRLQAGSDHADCAERLRTALLRTCNEVRLAAPAHDSTRPEVVGSERPLQLNEMLSRLLETLDCDDPGQIEPALAPLRDLLPPGQFEQLRSMVEAFDFRAAEALAQHLANHTHSIH